VVAGQGRALFLGRSSIVYSSVKMKRMSEGCWIAVNLMRIIRIKIRVSECQNIPDGFKCRPMGSGGILSPI
jgi:hypothetical protein